ncbi:serine hydrolase [Fulvimarina sp. MAC3]|uniref:serine hydrolase domain-containing protein n=1 Tax=Fulvimarina sp. MAC3 TaxID=3148887 RepID=UPI0031FE09F2
MGHAKRSIGGALPGAVTLSLLFALSPSSTLAQDAASTPNGEIGTVREIYDGRLLPDIQVRTFRNIDKLFPTRTVKAGDTPHPLPDGEPADLTDLEFTVGDERYDLFETMSVNRISGLLVLKDGKIVFEDYELGNDRDTRWMSMSVVKSIVSTLIAAAIADGSIESIDDPLSKYMPELEDSAYGPVTVAQLLTMSSGVQWNETYTDPSSDRREMLDLQIAQEPGAILDFMASLPRATEPGTVWNYSTGETSVASELVAAATGMTVSDYLSEKIWKPYGMESDATWWLDAPDGVEIGGSGLSATLRDYARFGQFVLEGGVIDGERVVPEGWFPAAGQPREIGGKMTEYGQMWWPVAKGEAFKDDEAFAAIGIFGQHVYINPARNVVIAMWAAQPKPLYSNPVSEYSFLEAVTEFVAPSE